MIVTELPVNVDRSAAFHETSFKIRASAKAFKILSSGLYSDKIRAILRELGTNAADSHIMAGKPERRFTVHLPNCFESWFSIRDYGTGLSGEDIEGIYTTYFESNKTHSNDVTGCLGLGSKSPFSYTDNFTVVSYYNGKKLTYTAFMNEHGFPSVANLAEEVTQEENGLEVTFAVMSKDFAEFTKKAERVYTYFKVQPEIVGQPVNLNRGNSDYSGDNWKLFRNTASGNELVMGNVAYPVCLKTADCSHPLFNNVGIEIECKVGEVEMTASREALEYTDLTKATIKKATQAALSSWEKLVLDDLAAQPTYWDACLFFKDNGLWIKKGTKWNGREVSSIISFAGLPNSVEKFSVCRYTRSRGTGVKYRANEDLLQIPVEKSSVFVDDDLQRGTKLRVMQYVRQHGGSIVYVFKFANDFERQAFADNCGFPVDKLVKASSLPKIARKKNPNAGKKVVYKFWCNGTNNHSYWFNEIEPLVDVNGGVYVELDGWNVKGFGNGDSLSSMVRILRKADYEFNVYGVRKNTMKKIAGDTNWVSLNNKIAEIQKEHEKDKYFILATEEYLQYSNLSVFKDKMTDVDIGNLISNIEYVKKNKDKFRKLAPIMRHGTNEEQSISGLDEIKEKYPLLFFIMEQMDPIEWPVNQLIDYINMVNKA